MTVFRVYFRRRGPWGGNDNTLLVTGRKELDRILSRKTPIAVAWEKAKLHVCSCGRRGPWTEGWAWSGSWRAIEEGEPIWIACSQACRALAMSANEDGQRTWWSPIEPLRARERAKRQSVGLSETERAQLQRDRRTVPLAPDWKGAGWCRWCGGKIEHKRAKQMNWHPDCKRIWLLHYDRDVQARYLADRDGHDCWDCKQGGRWWRCDLVLAQYAWEARPACMIQTAMTEAQWREPYPDAGRKIDGVIVGLYSRVEWRPHCGGLEVDHDTPLWKIWSLPDDERKPFYGPKNLRLRCQPCHKAKSKREAAERAELRAKGPVDLDAAA